jgi:photosystem II stability/assembly factor-like uncharacterized protein
MAAIMLSPHDAKTVYFGVQALYRSHNRGDSWERISPDLSGGGPANLRRPDYVNQAISTIAESPITPGLIYAGTDDGHLHVTKDGGNTWTELTARLPHQAFIARVVASPSAAGTVYVMLRGRDDDDFAAYVYRSTDYGQAWTSLVANIPAGPVNVVREDPAHPNILYAGTDFGVYVSTNGGGRWEVLGGNLPAVPVTDLQIHPRDQMIVISTFARGIWVMDALKIRPR